MKEALLHKIWHQKISNYKQFTTTAGEPIVLQNTGQYNTGDGPDFSMASIKTADGLTIYGDVELHINEEDWFKHGHDTDQNYNRVILHIVLHPGKRPATTKNGYIPPSICLLPFLQTSDFKSFFENHSLPCSSGLNYISQDVIKMQFNKALKEYFEVKTKVLLNNYNPTICFDNSLKEILILAIANGLGIAKNREPMEKLASLILQNSQLHLLPQIETFALETCGLLGNSTYFTKKDWDFSGSRPGNKPKQRILQLSEFIHRAINADLKQCRKNPDLFWKELTKNIKGSRNRLLLLYHTVYLPFLNVLSSLVHDKKLSSFAFDRWVKQHLQPPKSVIKPFESSGINNNLYNTHLGVVHQRRFYCNNRNCEKCLIMDAILKNSA